MPYTETNYKTKKQVKEALKEGTKIRCFQPGPFGPDTAENGYIALEGPHYPEPHRWYGAGTMKDGLLVSIK